MLQRRDGLVEDFGMLGRLAVTEVALVIQANGQNLRRFARIEQLHIAQFVRGTSRLVIAEEIALDFADCVAVQNSVCSRGTAPVAYVFRHVSFSLSVEKG